MPSHPLQAPDALSDFDAQVLQLESVTWRVWVAGHGPAVLVLPEMPGISPHMARFARWVRDAGLRVYMPSLFGTDGAIPSAPEGLAVFRRACVSALFRAVTDPSGARQPSPAVSSLRALARHAWAESGGPGVGVVGMCFTGNFALSMMMEPAVLAPVVCQPSLPLGDPGAVDMAADELALIRTRLEAQDLTVMAYRFEGDPFCRAERFAAYQAALGPRFVAHTVPDDSANQQDLPPFFREVVASPHSVVTVHLIDEAGQPTAHARDDIIRFLQQRLCPLPPTSEGKTMG
jgi:dienelactone hydrolase